MNGYPRLSVIVPVYRVEDYLDACIQSVVKQTFADFELILVDDGSPDGCPALCDGWAEKDARVRVLHQPNGGISAARNAALDTMRGAYLLFLDSDDYLAPDAAERLLALADAFDKPDFVEFRSSPELERDWRPGQEAEPRLCTERYEMFAHLRRGGGDAAMACSKLYRADLFDGLRFKRGIHYEDEQLITELLPRCKRVVYTELVLYGYVQRAGSITHSAFTSSNMDAFPVMDRRMELLRDLGYEDLLRETQAQVFVMAAWGYWQARRGGCNAELARLKEILKALSAERGLPLRGQYGALYRLLRVSDAAPELWYGLRRLLGKS